MKAGESPTHVVIGGQRESGRKERKSGKNYPRIPSRFEALNLATIRLSVSNQKTNCEWSTSLLLFLVNGKQWNNI